MQRGATNSASAGIPKRPYVHIGTDTKDQRCHTMRRSFEIGSREGIRRAYSLARFEGLRKLSCTVRLRISPQTYPQSLDLHMQELWY